MFPRTFVLPDGWAAAVKLIVQTVFPVAVMVNMIFLMVVFFMGMADILRLTVVFSDYAAC